MTKIVTITGMKCEHCEAHVKEALEKVDGVVSAKADRTKNEAVVELSKDVADKALISAINDNTRYHASDVKKA
jgi:copper chaperone CopZ